VAGGRSAAVGNGITFGAIAARLIADLYLRRPNADADVFSFKR